MVLIAEAVHDEKKRYSAGVAGDQTGDEVRIRRWYSRPWNYVLRWTDRDMANKFAYAMRAAANNPNIGYDQGQRNTLLTKSKPFKYDPAKATTCECDCSSLVSVAAMYAGVPEGKLFKWGNCSTTGNLRSRLISGNWVTAYSSKDFTKTDVKLVVGDILLYEGHHVAAVIESSNKLIIKDMDTIVNEVIEGKWGSGTKRKTDLTNAGYNYKEVQAAVNKKLKEGVV